MPPASPHVQPLRPGGQRAVGVKELHGQLARGRRAGRGGCVDAVELGGEPLVEVGGATGDHGAVVAVVHAPMLADRPGRSRPPPSPGVVESCSSSSADTTGSATPTRRHRSGSSASDTVSHGTNGSQMRSTSARLICDEVAMSTISTAAAARSSTARSASDDAGRRGGAARRRSSRQTSTATPAPSSGAGREEQQGQVAQVQ